MPRILMLKGLPASGKSTYARELVKTGEYVRVNKDELRDMLHDGKWSKGNEKQVLYMRDIIVSHTLGLGKNIVVDDTNLAPKHEQALRMLAQQHGAEFKVKFFEITVEEAIERDLKRLWTVGEKVIRQMYNQYLRPEVKQYVPDPELPEAVICDIDGTLAHMNGRSPYDWSRVGEDTVDENVAYLLHLLGKSNIKVILVSGRDGVCANETTEWLKKHDIHYDHLFMRAESDNRDDRIVKREIFLRNIKPYFGVQFVLDDRDKVVDMWRNDIGLKCLQVAEGAF